MFNNSSPYGSNARAEADDRGDTFLNTNRFLSNANENGSLFTATAANDGQYGFGGFSTTNAGGLESNQQQQNFTPTQAKNLGSVFTRHPQGVNLGFYEPVARAFHNDGQQAQVRSPQKISTATTTTTTMTTATNGSGLREQVAPQFKSMLFQTTQRGDALNALGRLDARSPAGAGADGQRGDLFGSAMARNEKEREVNFGNINARGTPLFTRDTAGGGAKTSFGGGNKGRRTSIGGRDEDEERINASARATTAGAGASTLGTAFATRNAEVDANDPAAVENAVQNVQAPCWVTVFGFASDDATFVLSKLQKIGDVVQFGTFLPTMDDEFNDDEEDFNNNISSQSSKKAVDGFSPRKYHGSPIHTRKFGSHSAVGSANWLHVKFERPEFAKRALQLNGARLSDRLMIGVKPLSDGDARIVAGLCGSDDVADFGRNKRNAVDRSPRKDGKRIMLNGAVALQPRRGNWTKVVEFIFGA